MRVIFRTDASVDIGTGHVMRCLTLAGELSANGVACEFICREHPGHLNAFIRDKGHKVHCLAMGHAEAGHLRHGLWLGATQAQDAEACLPILLDFDPDWLVVDHYALDAHWESAVLGHCKQLMVIDDLADRKHTCHTLLDQTLGRTESDYRHLLTLQTQLLCGAEYALLRPEFLALRPFSLARRKNPQLKKLLISVGGVDKDNLSSELMKILRRSALPFECEIHVIMGTTAPHLSQIMTDAENMPWTTQVLVGVSNMAEWMANCDLAIGAAGSTSWERCCLGLPTIMITLAENQILIAKNLAEAGAAAVVKSVGALDEQLCAWIHHFANSPQAMSQMSLAASQIVDGKGVCKVTAHMGR
jgi:UDP-2,4-diacetamido-2,4,6-trideoxy-beta-L-altropyranose hydrolase